MSILVSIDPGVHHVGLAVWDEGVLFKAGRCNFIAQNLAAYVVKDILAPTLYRYCPYELVVEKPQAYVRARSKGDPNDLIDLAITVGVLIGACSYGNATFYKPSEWKGNLPKPKRKGDLYPVEERCRQKLSQEEWNRITFPRAWKERLDVVDAVGLGLKHLEKTGTLR